MSKGLRENGVYPRVLSNVLLHGGPICYLVSDEGEAKRLESALRLGGEDLVTWPPEPLCGRRFGVVVNMIDGRVFVRDSRVREEVLKSWLNESVRTRMIPDGVWLERGC